MNTGSYLDHLTVADQLAGAVVNKGGAHPWQDHEEDDDYDDHMFFLQQSAQCTYFTLEE